MRELVAAWPPSGDGVDGQRAQTLGRGVHRRGQPGRSGADDDDVVAAFGQRVGRQTELEGELAGRRPLEHAPRRDGDRQVGGASRRGRSRRAATSASVSASIQWCGSRLRAAYSRSAIDAGVNSDPTICSVSAAARHQRRSAGEERLEDDVAQPRVGQHPRAEDVGRHHHDLARLGDPGRQVRALPGDQVDLAEEPAGAVAGDQLAVRPEHLDERH